MNLRIHHASIKNADSILITFYNGTKEIEQCIPVLKKLALLGVKWNGSKYESLLKSAKTAHFCNVVALHLYGDWTLQYCEETCTDCRSNTLVTCSARHDRIVVVTSDEFLKMKPRHIKELRKSTQSIEDYYSWRHNEQEILNNRTT